MVVLRKFLAELVGTFLLVFVGSMAVDVSSSLVEVALAHGLTLMAMVYVIGPVSGCHINPAITVSLMVFRKVKPVDGVAYIVFQLLGASLAGFLHAVILPGSGTFYGLTLPGGAINGDEGLALLVEAVATFSLGFAVYMAAVSGRVNDAVSGLVIGLTLSGAILAVGPLTGASLNPARTFGPALASGNFTAHWVYWIGPILGGLVGMAAARAVAGEK
ncbi:MAG: aquaporin [Nitrososphaerota archaeon]